MKKFILSSILLAALTFVSIAGNQGVAWDAYVGDPSITVIKIYAVPGTNTSFTAGNANATVVKSTAVGNTSLTISNLTAGAWTFTATAATLANGGVESSNSNVIWMNVFPGAVINFRFGP